MAAQKESQPPRAYAMLPAVLMSILIPQKQRTREYDALGMVPLKMNIFMLFMTPMFKIACSHQTPTNAKNCEEQHTIYFHI